MTTMSKAEHIEFLATVKPGNSYAALVHALTLAILAPDDSRAKRATAIAEDIASGMSAFDVDCAKREAAHDVKFPPVNSDD